MDSETMCYRVYERWMKDGIDKVPRWICKLYEWGTLIIGIVLVIWIVCLHSYELKVQYQGKACVMDVLKKGWNKQQDGIFVVDILDEQPWAGLALRIGWENEHEEEERHGLGYGVNKTETPLLDSLKEWARWENTPHNNRIMSKNSNENEESEDKNRYHTLSSSAPSPGHSSYVSPNQVGKKDMAAKVTSPFSIRYIVSMERGFLSLSEEALKNYNISRYYVQLNISDVCGLGKNEEDEDLLLLSLKEVLGWETFILNQLALLTNYQGFVLIWPWRDFYNLYRVERWTWHDMLFTSNWHLNLMRLKGILSQMTSSILIYFLASTGVSVFFKAVQMKMIHVSLLIQRFMRARMIVRSAVFKSIAQTLLICVFFLGLLSFFTEYLEDYAIALGICIVCWVSESFMMFFGRTLRTVTMWPKIFFVYIFLYLFYLFSHPLGYTHLTFIALLFFVSHGIIYFLINVELPAFKQRHIHPGHRRDIHVSNPLIIQAIQVSMLINDPARRQIPASGVTTTNTLSLLNIASPFNMTTPSGSLLPTTISQQLDDQSLDEVNHLHVD